MINTYRVVRSEMGDPTGRPLWAIMDMATGLIVEDFFYTPQAAQSFIQRHLTP